MGSGRYVIRNLTKGKKAEAEMEIADTPIMRTVGLMFRKKIVPMLFVFEQEGIYPIHSYFVRGKFDAAYISKGKVVVEVFKSIAPNTPLVMPKKKALWLLELPPSLSRLIGIGKGDKISWEKVG